MIRQICRSCQRKGHLTKNEQTTCDRIAADKYKRQIKAVKIWCSDERDDSTTCAGPELAKDGWINWGKYGAEMVCPCVRQFIKDCTDKGAYCALNKVQQCPKVCDGFKGRVQAARNAGALVEDANDEESSRMEATKDEDELNNRARVLVDARGKTSRNSSASIMSLDNSMTGKCSQ